MKQEEIYHPCTYILIQGILEMKDQGHSYRILSDWDEARKTVDKGFLKQKEAMNGRTD
jgi:hypothetical protein